jgi:hypothetical protein
MAPAIRFEGLLRKGVVKDYSDLARLPSGAWSSHYSGLVRPRPDRAPERGFRAPLSANGINAAGSTTGLARRPGP